MHFIQRKILFDLLFEQSLRFADLKPFEMESSQFMFHVKHLVKEGLVTKQGSTYKLTTEGKEVANRLDVENLNLSIQAKITTVMCVIRDNKYLIYKRLKNPFYGCMGFPTHKAQWGETLSEAVKQGLKLETGLSGDPKLFAIRHYLVNSPEKLLIEDKLMHAFVFENTTGELNSSDYFWVGAEEIPHVVTKPQEEFFELFEALKNRNQGISFKEISVETLNF